MPDFGKIAEKGMEVAKEKISEKLSSDPMKIDQLKECLSKKNISEENGTILRDTARY